MATHSDPALAAIQNKTAAGQKSTSVPIHPADSKALITQISSFTDASLQRRLTYASQNGITVSLTDTEMKSLLADIAKNTR